MKLSQQAAVVRDHLFTADHLTALQATGVYRIRSVSSRISELRRAGYDIRKERKRDALGQPYVRYAFTKAQRRTRAPLNPPTAPAVLIHLPEVVELYAAFLENHLDIPFAEAAEESQEFARFVAAELAE